VKQFYIARVRKEDQAFLKRMGFLFSAPYIDEYAFVSMQKGSHYWRTKEKELGVKFLRKPNGAFEKVSEARLELFTEYTRGSLQEGDRVRVVAGVEDKLEGRISILENGRAFCVLEGYKLIFERWIEFDRLVKETKGEDGKVGGGVSAC